MDVISGTKKRVARTPEFWQEVRELVERGMTLKKVSQRFELCWSSLVHRAQREGWKLCYRGRPRIGDNAQRERRREQLALEQRRQEEAQAALEQEAGVLVIDVRRAELLAEKVLKQHSVRLKVALSEWAVRTAEGLQKGEVRLRDQAQAMLAIKAIGRELYDWDQEPDLERMKLAGTNQQGRLRSYLDLVAMSPEQLRATANEQLAKENQDGQPGASGTESDNQCVDSPPVAWDAPSTPEKEAPPDPLKQPVQPRQEPLLQQAQKASVQESPVPGSQAWHRLRLEELARLRAEWRGRR